jgi:GMP synthase (glutamine-hydrolysing)
MSKVVILDAGAQYAKVIDRRVRELNVESIIMPLETKASELKGKFDAIIISGGPESVYGDKAPKYDPKTFELKLPILGICYGLQLLNHVHGGKVEKKATREDGVFDIDTVKGSKLFQKLDSKLQVLLTHGDSISEVAPGFKCTAKSSSGIVAAIESEKKNMYGVQFHPEVDLTTCGTDIFRNFLYEICKFKGTYTMKSRKDTAIQEIKDTVGDKDVLTLVSGGVDSTVCTALLQAAIPSSKIHAIHVDSGFMRSNESSNVKKALAKIGIDLKVVVGVDTFANATTKIDGKETEKLCETVQPEVKRKIIGDTFMRISETCCRELKLDASRVRSSLSSSPIHPHTHPHTTGTFSSRYASSRFNRICLETCQCLGNSIHHQDTSQRHSVGETSS